VRAARLGKLGHARAGLWGGELGCGHRWARREVRERRSARRAGELGLRGQESRLGRPTACIGLRLKGERGPAWADYGERKEKGSLPFYQFGLRNLG
jgi:hypothetical protein